MEEALLLYWIKLYFSFRQLLLIVGQYLVFLFVVASLNDIIHITAGWLNAIFSR